MKYSEELIKRIKTDYIENFLSLKEICDKYGFKSKSYVSNYHLLKLVKDIMLVMLQYENGVKPMAYHIVK